MADRVLLVATPGSETEVGRSAPCEIDVVLRRGSLGVRAQGLLGGRVVVHVGASVVVVEEATALVSLPVNGGVGILVADGAVDVLSAGGATQAVSAGAAASLSQDGHGLRDPATPADLDRVRRLLLPARASRSSETYP
jgi:hypothetical protein